MLAFDKSYAADSLALAAGAIHAKRAVVAGAHAKDAFAAPAAAARRVARDRAAKAAEPLVVKTLLAFATPHITILALWFLMQQTLPFGRLAAEPFTRTLVAPTPKRIEAACSVRLVRQGMARGGARLGVQYKRVTASRARRNRRGGGDAVQVARRRHFVLRPLLYLLK